MVRIKSIEEIQNFTCLIRSLRKGLITNFYLNVEKHSIWIEAGEFFVHETPECIFFLHENGNFYHLFFTATSTDSLCAALQKASFCNELLSIDILGAKENVVKDALVNIGFYEYKSLYRMYHIGYPLQYEMEKIADMATIKDIDEIYHILNQQSFQDEINITILNLAVWDALESLYQQTIDLAYLIIPAFMKKEMIDYCQNHHLLFNQLKELTYQINLRQNHPLFDHL